MQGCRRRKGCTPLSLGPTPLSLGPTHLSLGPTPLSLGPTRRLPFTKEEVSFRLENGETPKRTDDIERTRVLPFFDHRLNVLFLCYI